MANCKGKDCAEEVKLTKEQVLTAQNTYLKNTIKQLRMENATLMLEMSKLKEK